MPNPIHNGPSKHGTQDHRPKEDAEGEGSRILSSQSLDGEHEGWEDQRDGEGKDGEHDEIQLRFVINEDEEELGYCVEDESNKQRELHPKLVYDKASDRETISKDTNGRAKEEHTSLPHSHVELVDAEQQEGQVVDEEDQRGKELENENKPYFEGLLAAELVVNLSH